ncbi:hypothetical protein [Paractinoplanes brasiliensis]|uniref:Uncharacterized protein n=1 Tax=Paractinoplanes brasiliensis TaxID=52695 RepID=A0A4R6JZG8_9ACTN|nr:hypothetical protein [Actinoplanes brasiliensis]TDO41312.1 hypothetical protein C8E87_5042 [Actinoplanes brasiliensis]GID27406.1 hypothetical protein Abr02nite_23890 [Actinoplanes brasiliensis]
MTVRRRLRSLAALELLNIPLQAVVWFGAIGLPPSWPNMVGFALFALLLLQGAAYWRAKLRALSPPQRALPWRPFFLAARATNPILLLAGIALTGYAAVTDPGRSSWPGLAFAVFAVLEYINYFHLQLANDTRADLRRLRHHGLRRSHLARDLSRPPPV